MTTTKWIWWIFLFIAPLLALLLLRAGSAALPVSVALSAIPVFVTRRLLAGTWRTERPVLSLYVALTVSAVLLVLADPARSFSMHVPAWIPSLLGFYFVTAPLVMAGMVLFELHVLRTESRQPVSEASTPSL